MKKNCLNAKSNDFDQQTVCGALVCWSKYTTDNCIDVKPNGSNVLPMSGKLNLKDLYFWVKLVRPTQDHQIKPI